MLLSMQGRVDKAGGGLGAVLSLENWLMCQAFCESADITGNLIPVTGGNGSDKLTQASCPPSASAALGEPDWRGLRFRSSRSLRPALLCPSCSCSLLFTPASLAWRTPHTHSVFVE